MTFLDFREVMVLTNVDQEWRTTREIRGALRLTVPQVAGLLKRLRNIGYVTSRVDASMQWSITQAGRRALADLRDD